MRSPAFVAAQYVLKPTVARVPVFGSVSTWARTDELLRALRRVELGARFRAAVLDIDCPGGSMSNFEYLYRAVTRLGSRKPLVAHVRGIGASGGYLLASAASRVIALETSLVGAIGVVSVRPLVGELLGRLGVRIEVTKSGDLKDMWAPYREPTVEEREKQQAIMDASYEWFIARVSESRRMPVDQIRACATGEVFTARDALRLGLVDEIGDVERAIQVAALEAGIVPRAVSVQPRLRMFERAIGTIGVQIANAFRGHYV